MEGGADERADREGSEPLHLHRHGRESSAAGGRGFEPTEMFGDRDLAGKQARCRMALAGKPKTNPLVSSIKIRRVPYSRAIAANRSTTKAR